MIRSPIPKHFISSVEAASEFKKTNDYIAALCRRGAVRGTFEDHQWYVDPSSLVSYFAKQEELRELRRQQLSAKLAQEYRERVGEVSVQSAVQPAITLPQIRLDLRVVGFASGAALLVGALVFASSAHIPNTQSLAAVTQAESPFFGTQAPAVTFPTSTGNAFAGATNFLSNMFSALFGGNTKIAEIVPPTNSAPLAPSDSKTRGQSLASQNSSPASATVVTMPQQHSSAVPQNRSGSVAQVLPTPSKPQTVVSVGVSEAELTSRLQDLYNRLAVQISNLQNPGHESPLQNFVVSERINNLSNVRLNGDTIADNVYTNYVQSAKLNVSGDTAIGGSLSAGTTTVAALTVNGDLQFANATSSSTFATNASSTNLSAQNAQFVFATSTNFFAGTASTTNLFAQNASLGALNITGTSNFFNGFISQASTTIGNGLQNGGLTIFGGATTTGNAYFASGLGIGIATSAPGVLQTSSNAYIGGNLFVGGNSVTLGNSSANSLVINSSIKSSLTPDQNIQYDLGSPSFYWRNVYVGNIIANNISAASTTIAGTASATFTINSDNVSSDAEDMDLIFFRGNVVPNALISWKSVAKRFELNQATYISNQSGSLTTPTLTLQGSAGQTSDIFQIASSSGSTLFAVGPYGATTTTNAYFGGTIGLGQNVIAQSGSYFTFTTQSQNIGLYAGAGQGIFFGTNAQQNTWGILSSTNTFQPGTDNAYNIGGPSNRVANMYIGTSLNVSGLSTLGFASTTQISSTGNAYFATAGGNVGIGTTNPQYALDIQGSTVNADGIGPQLSITDTEINNAGHGPGILFTAPVSGLTKPSGRIYSAFTQNAYVNSNFVFQSAIGDNVFVNDFTAQSINLNGALGGALGVNLPVSTGAHTVASWMEVDGSQATGGADVEPILTLARPIHPGPSYPQVAQFSVGGYSGVNKPYPNTRLDISLKTVNSPDIVADNTIMTLQSNGNVGIGSTSPSQLLSVQGNAYFASNVGIGTSSPSAGLAVVSDASTRFAVEGSAANGVMRDIDVDSSGVVTLGTYYKPGNGYLLKVNTPAKIVEIGGESALQFKSGNANYIYDSANYPLISGGWNGARNYKAFGYNTNQLIFDDTTAEGNVGIGTTSPYARFTIATPNGSAGSMRTLFAIASSTASATTTLFSVQNSGFVGIGTTSPSQTLSIQGNQYTSGNATFGGTIGLGQNVIAQSGNYFTFTTQSQNIGLYAGGGQGVYFGTNAQQNTWGILSSSNTFQPGSDNLYNFGGPTNRIANGYFGTSLSVSGNFLALASSTIGDGTQAGGLTINGGATTTLNAYFGGRVGIGTTSPGATLAVAGNALTNALLPNGPYTNNLSSYDLGATGSRWNAVWAGAVNIGTSTFSMKANASNGLGFYNAASGGGTEVLTLSPGGNVGIGTPGPAAKLDINLSGSSLFRVSNTTNTAASTNTAFIHTDESFLSGSNTGTYTGAALLVTTYPQNVSGNVGDALKVGTSDSAGNSFVPFFQVKSATGFVGIGTSTPYAMLSVNPNGIGTAPAFAIGSSTRTLFAINNAGAMTYGGVTLSPSVTGTGSLVLSSSPSITLGNATGLPIDAGTTGTLPIGRGGTGSAGATGTGNVVLQFGPALTGSASAQTFSVSVLYNAGNNVDGHYACQRASVDGLIGYNSSCSQSDERLKENIQTLPDARGLDAIRQLRAVTFDWKDERRKSMDGHQIGLIAQEVSPLFPELVGTTPGTTTITLADGTKQDIPNTHTLNYMNLTAPMILAIQELDAQVQSQQVFSTSTASNLAASSTSPISGFSSMLQSAVGGLGSMVVKVFNSAIYAAVGIFNSVYAKDIHADQICASKSAGGEVCVTGDQLEALLSGTATSTPNGGQDNGGGNATSTDSVAPEITLIGDNPATVAVGTSYIDPGVSIFDVGSPNIGYTMSLDGATSTSPDQFQLDTATSSTHIILYSATDQAGNTGTATRTVIVE